MTLLKIFCDIFIFITSFLLLFPLAHNIFDPKSLFDRIFTRISSARRLARISTQFVDAVTLVASAVSAGTSVTRAIELASLETPSPLGDDLGLIIAEMRIGRTFEEALRSWEARTPIEEVSTLVEALIILKETGGNIVTTLRSAADLVRERQKISSRIRVLTSQGVAEAAILLAMPFVLMLAMRIVSPGYIEPLFTTRLGIVLLSAAVLLMMIGALIIRKIVVIRV